MLSKEEIEKAKEKLIKLKEKVNIEDIDMNDCFNGEHIEAIQILLQYIDQLEQENDTQNKIIDEMGLALASYDIDEEICKNQVAPLCDKNSLEVTVDICVKCIKQYFEKKVEEE